MYKYIFNTNGEYVAYIYNGTYCFSSSNDYIGFFKGIDLYDYNGVYLGSLTSDDRIIKSNFFTQKNTLPIPKPLKPYLPLKPYNRYKMSSLGSAYRDIFIDYEDANSYKKYDKLYEGFLNCRLYGADGTFLGVLSLNKYDSDSLANKYGIYGSQYNQLSIFNKYGTYGSEYNSMSPFNKYSNTPTYLKDSNNNIVAKISDNKYIRGAISATELFNWYKEKIK